MTPRLEPVNSFSSGRYRIDLRGLLGQHPSRFA
ncbi:uncharacterized protein METZ01_LOCUS13436 [marine metagenome]|uniref:Uncharacterized protein n=1 Tax=marine metagenome TaxID=408172 RepID=A0A381P105_9ZZZZ